MLVIRYSRAEEIHVMLPTEHQFLLYIVIEITTTSQILLFCFVLLAWNTCGEHGSARGSDTHF